MLCCISVLSYARAASQQSVWRRDTFPQPCVRPKSTANVISGDVLCDHFNKGPWSHPASNISRENGWTWSRECDDVAPKTDACRRYSFPIGRRDRACGVKKPSVAFDWTQRLAAGRAPPPPQQLARLSCASSGVCVTEAGLLLPDRPGVSANTRPVHPNWHRGRGAAPARLTPERRSGRTPRLSLSPPPVPPDVGLQAGDRAARPCGREGELDLRAAMCGRGRARGDH